MPHSHVAKSLHLRSIIVKQRGHTSQESVKVSSSGAGKESRVPRFRWRSGTLKELVQSN